MFWRRNKIQPPTQKTDYPSGLCVKTENGHFYIKGGFRYKVSSKRVLESWRFQIIKSTEAACRHIPVVENGIGFRDGTVIKDFSDNKYYIISGNKKRHIQNPDILSSLCLESKDALSVSHEEASLNKDGEVLI